jgi:hypothetical protein
MKTMALSLCHPEAAQRGEGPRNWNWRALGSGISQLQLRGPSPSARLGMTNWEARSLGSKL